MSSSNLEETVLKQREEDVKLARQFDKLIDKLDRLFASDEDGHNATILTSAAAYRMNYSVLPHERKQIATPNNKRKFLKVKAALGVRRVGGLVQVILLPVIKRASHCDDVTLFNDGSERELS